MQVRALGSAGLIAIALMFGMFGTAFAHDDALKAYAEASPADQPTDGDDESIKPTGAPLSQQEDDVLSRALLFDSSSMTQNAPAPSLKVPRLSVPATDIGGTNKDDGTGTVTVKIAPPSGLFAAAMLPPIASMKPRAIDSPRPVPARFRSATVTR